MIKKMKLMISSHRGTFICFFAAHAASHHTLTTIFIRIPSIQPKTMMVERTSPSGGWGRYRTREAKR